jgi:hypothetical protein
MRLETHLSEVSSTLAVEAQETWPSRLRVDWRHGATY